jgi:O-antigen ligase
MRFSTPSLICRAALASTLGAAISIAGSIAVSQSLLGFALFFLLLAWLLYAKPPQLPAGWRWLALFMAWTLASWLVNGHLREGRFQIRKFYVLLITVAIASTFRSLADLRRLVLGWIALASLSGLWGMHQFWHKWQAAQLAHDPFYRSYLGARITGFSGHWMTFSQQLMFALLAAVALLVWDRTLRSWPRWLVLAGAAVCGLAIVLAMTRGVWFATLAGLLYLLWNWRRWTLVVLPVLLIGGYALGPSNLRERVQSILAPHGATDSNQHRYVTFRTGVEMIKAHPLFGIGPDMVRYEFQSYVPADIAKPLPEGFYGHLHCIYTQYAAERGVPALLAMLAFFLTNVYAWLRELRRTPVSASSWALRAGVAMVAGMLVAGLFEHNLGDSEILTMSLAAVAAVASVTHAGRSVEAE